MKQELEQLYKKIDELTEDEKVWCFNKFCR